MRLYQLDNSDLHPGDVMTLREGLEEYDLVLFCHPKQTEQGGEMLDNIQPFFRAFRDRQFTQILAPSHGCPAGCFIGVSTLNRESPEVIFVQRDNVAETTHMRVESGHIEDGDPRSEWKVDPKLRVGDVMSMPDMMLPKTVRLVIVMSRDRTQSGLAFPPFHWFQTLGLGDVPFISHPGVPEGMAYLITYPEQKVLLHLSLGDLADYVSEHSTLMNDLERFLEGEDDDDSDE